jgi:hypothetical protein
VRRPGSAGDSRNLLPFSPSAKLPMLQNAMICGKRKKDDASLQCPGTQLHVRGDMQVPGSMKGNM